MICDDEDVIMGVSLAARDAHANPRHASSRHARSNSGDAHANPDDDEDLVMPIRVRHRGARDFGALVVSSASRSVVALCKLRWHLSLTTPVEDEQHWAMCTYTLLDLQMLAQPVTVPAGLVLKHCTSGASRLMVVCRLDQLQCGQSCGDYMAGLAGPSYFKAVMDDVMSWANAGGAPVVREVRLRRLRNSHLLPRFPGEWSIRSLRRAALLRSRASSTSFRPAVVARENAALLELPNERVARKLGSWSPTKRSNMFGGEAHKPVDPVDLVMGLNFSRLLRSTVHFTEALDAGVGFQSGSLTVDRCRSRDLHRSQLRRQSRRLDVVSMLLQRRECESWRSSDSIDSILVQSDASPVTGDEVQGMVLDIVLKTDVVLQWVLPGCSLSYGECDAISKCLCFVWAVFLVAGPTHAAMKYFMSKVP